jgi:hypothetical protein
MEIPSGPGWNFHLPPSRGMQKFWSKRGDGNLHPNLKGIFSRRVGSSGLDYA